jgi:dipeptidyl aminopeptidase/acylaminoacyl peptidase
MFTLTPTPYPPSPTLAGLRNPTPNRTLTAQPLPTATRLPPDTPLQTVPAVPRSGLWAENLIFGEPQPVDEWRVDGSMDWSPDGKQLAFVVATDFMDLGSLGVWPINWIVVLDVDTRFAKYLVRGENPQWSPDGKKIAYENWVPEEDRGHIRFIDVTTKEFVQVADIRRDDNSTIPAWLSVNELAFSLREPVVYDIRTGRTNLLFAEGLLSRPRVDFEHWFFASLPEKNLFAVAARGDIFLFEWLNGAARFIRSADDQLDDIPMAFSPDGKLFAYGPRGTIKIVNVHDKSINVVMPGNQRSTTFGNWSPDGASLTYWAEDYSQSEARIVNRDGSGLQTIPGPSIWASAPIWSPRGDTIVWIEKMKDCEMYPEPKPKCEWNYNRLLAASVARKR